jgi:uncharacterized integral membrane protein
LSLFRRRLGPGELHEFQPRLYAILIGLFLLCAYVIAFIVENSKKVSLHFVLFTARVSLIWLILLGLAIGFVGGILTSQLYRRRSRSRQ